MKKKLIISLLLVVVLCTSISLVACKKVNSDMLDILFDDLKEAYPATAITNESYKVASTMSDYDDDGKLVECNLLWTIGGTTAITLSDVDADGYITVNVPAIRDSQIDYTLTVSLVNGKKVYQDKDGNDYTLTLQRTAQKTDAWQNALTAFEQTIVHNPQAETAYKWATFKGNEIFYFAGKTGSNTHNYATTTNYAEAVDVYLETAEGGYYLYFMNNGTKTYMDLTTYDSGSYISGSTSLYTDKAQLQGGIVSIHETGALWATISYKDKNYPYFFGMRMQYPGEVRVIDATYLGLADETDMHSYKTNERPMYLVTGKTELPEQENLTEAQILEKAFALGANEKMGGVIELTGTVSKAQDIDNNSYGTIKITVADKEIECYCLVKASTLNVGDIIKVRGVLRNYTSEKDGVNKVEFDAGCTWTMVQKAPVEIPSNVDKVTAPQEETAYKITVNQEKNGKQIYMMAEMSTNWVKTSEDHFAGVDFYVEAATGGYKIYYYDADGTTKKYVGAVQSGNYKNLVLNNETVWTIDADGIHTTLGTTEVYIGTYDTFATLGVYAEGEKTDMWLAFLGALTEEASVVEVKLDKEYANADVVITPEAAKIGDEVTITVTAKNDYTIGEVKVNGVKITAEEAGVYKFTVKGNTVIALTLLDPSGEAPKGSATNPYTAEEARAEALKLSETTTTTATEKVYVKGVIVTEVKYFNSRPGFYIAASAEEGATQFQIYTTTVDEAIGTVYTGDEIVICGYLKVYVKDSNATPEMDQNNGDYPVVTEIIARGDASIKAAEGMDENITLTFVTTADTNNVVTGHNHDLVEFKLEGNDSWGVQTAKVNGTVVTANNEGVYSVRLNGSMEITVEVYEKSDTPVGPQTINGDLQGKFGTYAESWGTGYSAHEITASDLAINLPGIGVNVSISNCNKQQAGNTIDDMPVMAVKNTDQTCAISVTGAKIKSASITLAEWGTGKKFTKVIIEYTTDGTTWTKANGGYEGSAAAISAMGFTNLTIATGDLPANVTAVRLVVCGSSSSNTQLGLQAFSLVVE